MAANPATMMASATENSAHDVAPGVATLEAATVDAELVVLAQSASALPEARRTAFGELVGRYQDLAYGYAYALLGDPHLSQDAAQEAFLAAYRSLPQLREPQAFGGWLRCIVRTHSLRLRRRLGPEMTSLARIDACSDSRLVDSGAGRVSASRVWLHSLRSAHALTGDPAQVVEARAVREQVVSALRALPQRERVATVLFYVAGYSQREVARFLDVPVNTVKKRLQAARARLQRSLSDMVRENVRAHRPSRDGRFVERLQVQAAFEAAAAEGELHLVELLLVDGVDVNAPDADGQTALCWAAQQGHLDVATLLLEQGAQVNARDATGKTALWGAEQGQHAELAALLLRHGAVREE